MAHNIEYSPVDVEDSVPPDNSHDFNEYANVGRAAILESRRRNDINRISNALYRGSSNNSLVSKDSTRRPRKSFSSCAFSLIILGVCVTFLLGVLVGFYVRESQSDPMEWEKVCQTVDDQVDYDVLGARHDAVVNYIRGINIKTFVDKFGADDPVTGSDTEKRLEEEVVSLFNLYGLDVVEIEEHDIVVTSPDPTKPNRLEVLHANGTLRHRFALGHPEADEPDDVTANRTNEKRGNKKEMPADASWSFPHVVFSPAGEVESSLVYGHFGLEYDFELLAKLGTGIKGRVVLLALGRTSVAEKIMNAERFGAAAVLLYQDSSFENRNKFLNLTADFIPTVSATIYSSKMTGLWTPSIPCQTISTSQATTLINSLFNNNIDTNDGDDTYEELMATGRDLTLKEFYSKNPGNGDLSIRLSIFNRARNQKIRNVIGTIQGYYETDHYVIVGAPRSSIPGDFQDVIASTSLLAQTAHGFHFVHQLHKYKPRRGVKFISWGGSEFSNAGALHYIKNHQHLLGSRAVAYFDMRLLVAGTDSVAAQTSASLHQLLKEAAFETPDPKNPEETLQSSWNIRLDRNKFPGGFMPFTSYDDDENKSPFLHMLGVPTVRVQFVDNTDNISSTASKLKSEEHKHHYKFHMAIVRVAIKSLMSVLDNEIVPLNIRNFAHELSDTVWQTMGVIEECTNDRMNFEEVMSACDKFIKSADAFEEVSRIFLTNKDKRGVQMCNSVKIMIEKMFVLRRNSLSHHILHPTHSDGSILLAEDLCKFSAAIQDWSSLKQLEMALTSTIKEAGLSLRLGA